MIVVASLGSPRLSGGAGPGFAWQPGQVLINETKWGKKPLTPQAKAWVYQEEQLVCDAFAEHQPVTLLLNDYSAK